MGGHSHLVLKGRSAAHGTSWTHLAQVYPRRLVKDLVDALGHTAGLFPRGLKLDISGCARCSSLRIGEALHPGPQRSFVAPRDPEALLQVPLVEPPTLALQQRIWAAFEKWLAEQLSPEPIRQVFVEFSYLAAVANSLSFDIL